MAQASESLQVTKARSWRVLLVILVASFAVATLGGIATAPNIPGWYAGLVKPSFNPPNWIFGPVWSLLYAVMSVAAWLAWRSAPSQQSNRIFGLYAVQLGVNLLWSVLFFALHLPLAALVDCLILLGLIILMAWFYGRFNALAGWLLVPYGLWVSFASLLNAAIVYLN